MHSRFALSVVIVSSLALAGAGLLGVQAQTNRNRKAAARPPAAGNPTVTRAIDVKKQKLEETFVRDAAVLAKEYSDAGDFEKSREVLRSILKINPRLSQVQDRIKQLEEGMLQQNGIEYELDTSRGWSSAIAVVEAGKKIRIQVSGAYEMKLESRLDYRGLIAGDEPSTLSKNIPVGGLMGMIVVNAKPERMFPIVDGLELTPKKSGLLAVRVNVPQQSRCTGKLKLKLTGGVVEPR